MPTLKIICLLMVLSLLAGCATKPCFDEEAAKSPQAPVPGSGSRLQVGDHIVLAVGTEATLDKEGWVDLPQIGRFHMLDMSESEAKAVLSKACREQGIILFLQPGYEPLYLEVTGEVNCPGRRPYLGRITLTGAIASAGGLTAAANRKQLMLHRTNRATERYVYDQILKSPNDDPELWPGDAVQVQKRKLVW
jgi:protein involved in polysaccharide export with SLBB domain